MAYIGKVPTAAPLTSSDITDAIITNAKLAQDIISADTALGATPADTDEFLVSDAGTLKRVDYSYLKAGTMAPVFNATINSTQAIANATFTKIEFDTETFDPSSTYDTTNYRWTPGVAGYVYLTATIKMGITNDFTLWLGYLRKNNTDILAVANPHTNKESLIMSTTDLADADDYYEVFCYQNKGDTENLSGSAIDFVFAGFKLIT